MKIFGPLSFDTVSQANHRIERWIGETLDSLRREGAVQDYKLTTTSPDRTQAEGRAVMIWVRGRLAGTAVMAVAETGKPTLCLLDYGAVGSIHVSGPIARRAAHAG